MSKLYISSRHLIRLSVLHRVLIKKSYRLTENLGSPEPGVDAIAQEQSNAESRADVPQERKMSTLMATMWLGTRSGNLYVHSAMANYSKCLARYDNILYLKRVFFRDNSKVEMFVVSEFVISFYAGSPMV